MEEIRERGVSGQLHESIEQRAQGLSGAYETYYDLDMIYKDLIISAVGTA